MNKKYLFLVLVFILSTFLCFSDTQTGLSKERQLTLKKAELDAEELYNGLNAAQHALSFMAFRYACIGYRTMKKQHHLSNKELFSIISFTEGCNSKRFYTIGLEKTEVVYYTYMTYGKRSGGRIATSFSGAVEPNKSSIGFYITNNTYNGGSNYSLILRDDEEGYNSNLVKRSVVVHTADYANEDYVASSGRIRRSLGYPALPKNIYEQVIETIKEKTMIFAYYNDAKYLKISKYLNTLRLIGDEPVESVF